MRTPLGSCARDTPIVSHNGPISPTSTQRGSGDVLDIITRLVIRDTWSMIIVDGPGPRALRDEVLVDIPGRPDPIIDLPGGAFRVRRTGDREGEIRSPQDAIGRQASDPCRSPPGAARISGTADDDMSGDDDESNKSREDEKDDRREARTWIGWTADLRRRNGRRRVQGGRSE